MSDEPPSPAKPPEGTDPAMDRRSRKERRGQDRRQTDKPVPVERRKGADRRKGARRAARSLNRYDMEADVLEFINAINHFKESSGRAFPTWSEVLSILKELGYEKKT